MKAILFTSLFALLIGCHQKENKKSTIENKSDHIESKKTSVTPDQIEQQESQEEEVIIDYSQLSDTAFVNLKKLDNSFAYDMRYATSNNFLKEKVYECNNCLVRYKVAKALIAANQKLIKKGYRIKFFDCFRPVAVQKKMWEIMPDSRYVANPNRSGSIHNRGAAVDITLETLAGDELDMGTGFDHFGKEAHHSYQQFSNIVISNRTLLKSTLESVGFSAIRTEWWHYILGKKSDFKISSQPLCNE